jgi:O-succinylbenzoate synthase
VNLRFAWRRYRLPFRQPVRTAHGDWRAREGIWVRLEDETGAAGFGEIAPLPEFGTETLAEAADLCARLGGVIDSLRMAEIDGRFGCVRFALESALPGATPAAKGSAPLPVAALLPAGRAAVAVLQARAEEGWRFFKWKVGVARLEDELAMLDDVVAALPSGASVRLDANGAWTARQAARWLGRCAERPVEFVEQPVAKEAADALLGLARDYPTPVALDEAVAGLPDLRKWIEAGWPGVFVVKPSLAGPAGELRALLESARADVVFSSALETAAGARAVLRLALAHRGAKPRAAGFGVWPLFADARFDGPRARPLLTAEDAEALQPENLWNALN